MHVLESRGGVRVLPGLLPRDVRSLPGARGRRGGGRGAATEAGVAGGGGLVDRGRGPAAASRGGTGVYWRRRGGGGEGWGCAASRRRRARRPVGSSRRWVRGGRVVLVLPLIASSSPRSFSWPSSASTVTSRGATAAAPQATRRFTSCARRAGEGESDRALGGGVKGEVPGEYPLGGLW